MKALILSMSALICLTSEAQIGNQFPNMSAETLSNDMLSIPKDLNGKYSLICLAYSSKAEDYLGQWFSPIYNNFIHKPETPSPFSFSYDVNVYFVPMITGVKRPAYKTTMKKTQQSVDPAMKPYILFYEGSLNDYKKPLAIEEKKYPHFFILDPTGKIVNKASGPYTDKKMQEIINDVRDALQQ